jgi:hypothetical protein
VAAGIRVLDEGLLLPADVLREACGSPILEAVTGGSSDWAGAYMRDEEVQAKRLSWVDRFRPALDLALDEFLATAQWPERERFRRKLTQRGLDDLSLDEMLQDMPRSPWGRNMVVPDRIVLSLQVLQELPKAKTLLDVCMAIVGRAYEQYSSETVDDPVLRSGDPVLLSAAGGDAGLLLRAREVLGQHPPGPLGGGGSGIDSTEWTRMLNDAAMPAFRGIATVGDYLAAQERIIGDDRRVYGRVPAMPKLSPFGAVLTQPTQTSPSAASAATSELFVIMPFSEAWSDGTYAFIRRAVEELGIPPEEIHLYRADEIASPGQISEQIKDAIVRAQVVIADITGVNPNVMWELGYADGKAKAIVILNQDPRSSPFDIADRRQVAYHASPTDSDETNLVRHLAAALRAE